MPKVYTDTERMIYLFDLLFEDTKAGDDKLARIRRIVDSALVQKEKEDKIEKVRGQYP